MKYAIGKNVLWKTVDDEVVIVDPEKQDYSYLNATGKDIWEMIRKGYTLAEMAAELAEKYDVSPAKAKAETEALVKDLLQTGLIQEAGGHDTEIRNNRT